MSITILNQNEKISFLESVNIQYQKEIEALQLQLLQIHSQNKKESWIF
jgi:hypothetical protein